MPLFTRLTKKLRYPHPTARVQCGIVQYKSDSNDRGTHPPGAQLLTLGNKKIDGQPLPLHYRGRRQSIEKSHRSDGRHRRYPENHPRVGQEASETGVGLLRGKSARGGHPAHPKIDEQLLKHRQSPRQRFRAR
jgi:hypothetical protein